jgi:hypothetical protein
MITLTVVYSDNDNDFETKINENESDGWAVRQIVVLPATTNNSDYAGTSKVHRSNIIVVFERERLA